MPNLRDMINTAHAKLRDETLDQQPEPDTEQREREAATLGALTMFALQGQRHIYAGTVPQEVVAQRRAKNRHARRARRGNTAAIRRQARLNHGKRRTANVQKRFGWPVIVPGINDPVDAEVVDE